MQKVAVAVWKSSLSFTTLVHQHLQDGTTKRNNMSLLAEIATLDRRALTILLIVADYPEKLSCAPGATPIQWMDLNVPLSWRDGYQRTNGQKLIEYSAHWDNLLAIP